MGVRRGRARARTYLDRQVHATTLSSSFFFVFPPSTPNATHTLLSSAHCRSLSVTLLERERERAQSEGEKNTPGRKLRGTEIGKSKGNKEERERERGFWYGYTLPSHACALHFG